MTGYNLKLPRVCVCLCVRAHMMDRSQSAPQSNYSRAAELRVVKVEDDKAEGANTGTWNK